MLFYYMDYVCYGTLLLALLLMACTGYAYSVNTRRANDDPQKRDFHPLAIVLAPITLPLYTIVGIVTFVLMALLFGVTLILLAAMLIFLRESMILKWLLKKAVSFGNKLLELNTAFIRLFWNPKATQSNTQKSLYKFDSLIGRFI